MQKRGLAALDKEGYSFLTEKGIGPRYAAINTQVYADDLQSSEASAKALQNKADIVSAWCLFTGINISYDKLRTFGVHWGVHKGDNPPLTIQIGKWEEMQVGMKSDGT